MKKTNDLDKKLKISYIFPQNKQASNQQCAKENSLEKQRLLAEQAYKKLMKKSQVGEISEMTGWIDYPSHISDELIEQIQKIATQIQEKSTVLIVVGIGGSYLGAKAALDFLIKDQKGMNPKIIFAGTNLDSPTYENILNQIQDEDVTLCIISKSGGTIETWTAANIFMDFLREKYGEEDKDQRIFTVTDPQNGRLHKLTNEKNYPTLPIPANIGGRFSVLTPVGLLPMAVAGIDIVEVLAGAKKEDCLLSEAKEMAAVRNKFENDGYTLELFAAFQLHMTGLIQWIKQLYGESEGKEGKGMFPAQLNYTEEIHSLGQFVQDGRQTFVETFMGTADNAKANINIPKSWGISNRDMPLTELNRIAKKGIIAAHAGAGVPIIDIALPDRSEYAFGQTIYFFQMTCAIRGIMMGINPFDQPGVERYKQEIKKSL